jgi:hypothetical protein
LIAAENIADSTRKSIGIHLIIFYLLSGGGFCVYNLKAIEANPLGALAFTIRILIPSNLPEKSIFMLLASVNYLSE